jgi:hypothetical protein
MKECEMCFDSLQDVHTKDQNSNTDALIDFFMKADYSCRVLNVESKQAKEKFEEVLKYFSEDANSKPTQFFSTWDKFIQVVLLLDMLY